MHYIVQYDDEFLSTIIIVQFTCHCVLIGQFIVVVYSHCAIHHCVIIRAPISEHFEGRGSLGLLATTCSWSLELPVTTCSWSMGLPATTCSWSLELPATTCSWSLGLPATTCSGSLGLPATTGSGSLGKVKRSSLIGNGNCAKVYIYLLLCIWCPLPLLQLGSGFSFIRQCHL